MALVATSGSNIGAYYLQIAFRDDNGYPMGTDTSPNAKTPGSTTSAFLIRSVIDFVPAAPTYAEQTVKGGQSIRSKTTVGVDDFGNPTFQLAEFDELLNAYIKATSVDTTTVDDWAISATNINQIVFPPMIAVVTSRFTESNTGGDYYMNYFYNDCEITMNQDQSQQQVDGQQTNPNPLQFTLKLSTASRTGFGRLLSATALGVQDSSDVMTKVRSKYPIALTTYVDDGTSTAGALTLPYKPAYNAAVTGAALNSITKNGTTATVTSINATSGSVNLTAGTSGDIWVFAYETEKFEAVA